jgi:beta-lactam-binding protein with PASTA domain
MKTKEFFGKIFSPFLLGNLLAMVVVIVLLCLGVKYGLAWYTHHDEGIKVPKVEGMIYNNALLLLEENGLNIMVTDSGFNKRLPANCILAQSPGEGTMVKEGHMIYVTVNSPSSPSFAIPDVIDNSSYREAEAKLTALGFKLLPPKVVMGEKDWVYGILSRGRRVSTGDMVSIDSPLTLMIGSGMYDREEEDFDYVEPSYQQFMSEDGGDDMDDFEEVMEP